MNLRKYHNIAKIFSMCLSLQTMGGCALIYEYDSCPDGFSVRSDWRYAPDASPESMAYIFFSTTSDRDIWRFDLPGREGGRLVLPDGEYSLLCLNDDSGTVLVSDPTSYGLMTATTLPARLYGDREGPDSLGNEAVMACCTQLWYQAVDKMLLSGDGVRWTAATGDSLEFSPSRTLTVYPRPAMASYTFEITDVENLDGISHMCAAITGMASRLSLCDGERQGPAVTLPLPARRDGSSTVTGSFLTFGLPASSSEVNELRLFVWLTDGRALSYAFDVSGQTRDAPDPMNVHIRVGGISLPPSTPAVGGAFDVSVDGWIETVINIDS